MARIKCIQSFFELFWSRLLLTKRYRSGPITRLSGSVEFVITRTLVIYPVMLRNCSRMQRVSDRSNSPLVTLCGKKNPFNTKDHKGKHKVTQRKKVQYPLKNNAVQRRQYCISERHCKVKPKFRSLFKKVCQS
jgi:hypothetical protein